MSIIRHEEPLGKKLEYLCDLQARLWRSWNIVDAVLSLN
jgi:hypothetical protein